MLRPTTFSGSSNTVVDQMSLNPITGNRLPIWNDVGRTQDIEFEFYIATPGTDGTAYSAEISSFNLGSSPSDITVSSDRSFDNEIRSVFESAESFTHTLKFEEVDNFNSSNIRVGIDTNNLSVHSQGGPGTGLRGFATPAGMVQNSAGDEVATSIFNDTISDAAGNNIFSVTSEEGGMAFRPRLFFHEVGHSLGLDHPFANTLGGRVSDYAALGMELNDNKYTVMTSPGNPALVDADHGFSAGYMALDIAAFQEYYGIGDNNTGDTTYNLTDGAQITAVGSNSAALDIDGADESRAELTKAFQDASAANGGGLKGFAAGARAYGQELSEQMKSGRFDGGEESIGRAYKTIYDGQREVDSAGKESIGNGGIDEISYAGAQQSAMINLNDAGLGADQTDAQYLDLQREIKGSDRWDDLNEVTIDRAGNKTVTNSDFQNDIDATVNDTTGALRSDAYSAGGAFSRLYETHADGSVKDIQDGGVSIAHGVKIENATGGEKADTLIGNEHDNVLTGNAGDDAMFGGHGNDTLNAGDGNDTLVAGRGNNQLDGGADLDTASYTNLYDPAVGVPITQGVSFSITGNQATITKPLNGAVLGPVGSSVETDNAVDVERFEGTARNDTFTVENLSGNMYIDGGAGQDTLTVKDPAGAYKLDMTGGTYPAGHAREGEAYEGTVSDGTNTVYLEDKDITVIIDAPAPPVPRLKPEISVEDAIQTLSEDQKTLNRQVEDTGVSTPATIAINHPDAAQMFKNLHDNGVPSIRADATPEMEPEERVGNLILAGQEATHEAGIPMPHEQNLENDRADVTPELSHQMPEAAYEEELSYGL